MAAFQPFMSVGDHQLCAAQPATREGAQELHPEWLGLTVADRHAKHLAPAVGVDADSHDDRDGHDVMVPSSFDVGGIQPDIRPIALDRPGQEGADALVDLGAEPGDLAFADALDPHGLHQVIHRARRDTLDVGFLVVRI